MVFDYFASRSRRHRRQRDRIGLAESEGILGWERVGLRAGKFRLIVALQKSGDETGLGLTSVVTHDGAQPPVALCERHMRCAPDGSVLR